MTKSKFISPKIDYAFKKIFGSCQSEDILISFLNAIVYNGIKPVIAVTITDFILFQEKQLADIDQ